MFRIFSIVIAAFLAIAPLVAQSPDDRVSSRIAEREEARYRIYDAGFVVTGEAREALDARGVTILRALGGSQYLVRLAPAADLAGLNGHFVAIEPEEKIASSARKALRQPEPFADLRVVFAPDIALDDAIDVVRAAGGTLHDPLPAGFGPLRSLRAWLPDGVVSDVARDGRVLSIHGDEGPVRPMNAQAALMSDVTPLYSAPYDLSGAGILVTVGEVGGVADAAHPEFEGRVTNPDGGSPASHATHVTGTVAAKGVRTEAKGMAPAVRVEVYEVGQGWPERKSSIFKSRKPVSDNNSWGFVTGWEQSSREWIWEWYGDDRFGAYSFSPASLDEMAVSTGTLVVVSAGNDNSDGGPINAPFHHYHQTEIEDDPKIYCISANGSGTDCPMPPCGVCERGPLHPPDGPFRTVNQLASAKNTITVGAITASGNSSLFSSRGPTRDGRIKPEVVAKGSQVISTTPSGRYGNSSGTSMAAPVVTGISAIVAEQWKKSETGPLPLDLFRALLINGATDLGEPGPDYTFGFGLVNAKNSVDTIRNDATRRVLMKQGTVTHGERIELPLDLPQSGKLKMTLAWTDPENTPFVSKTLVNDLDLELVTPTGSTVLPWVLDPAQPDKAATRGINTRDNVEQIEIDNAAAGAYKVVVKGTSVPTGGPQSFAIVSTAAIGGLTTVCDDAYEPNDTIETAWPGVAPKTRINAMFCTVADVDFYRFSADESGQVRIVMKPQATPATVSLRENGVVVAAETVGAFASKTITRQVGTGSGQPITPVSFAVEVRPAAADGIPDTYVLEIEYPSTAPSRRRGARR